MTTSDESRTNASAFSYERYEHTRFVARGNSYARLGGIVSGP